MAVSNNPHARRIRELKAELKWEEEALEVSRASRFGNDIYHTGDVLRFNKSFASGETYPYAAIKTGGYWLTCGSTAGGKAWTWPELVSWLNSGTPVAELLLVTNTKAIAPTPLKYVTGGVLDGLLDIEGSQSRAGGFAGWSGRLQSALCKVNGCSAAANAHSAFCAGHS